jgi:hypothetical protein
MLSIIRDWQQTLSWKLGHGHARHQRASRCPWWADQQIYSLAYLQGKGIEIPKLNEATIHASASKAKS